MQMKRDQEGKTEVVLSGFEGLSHKAWPSTTKLLLQGIRVVIIQPKLVKLSPGVTPAPHPLPPPYRGRPTPPGRHSACMQSPNPSIERGGSCVGPLICFLIQSLHINGEASGPSYQPNSSSPSLLPEAGDGDKIAPAPRGEGSVPATEIRQLPFSADIWALWVTIYENRN